MPPISGHGARTVVNVRSSEQSELGEGSELRPLGLRLFDGADGAHGQSESGPSLHR